MKYSFLLYRVEYQLHYIQTIVEFVDFCCVFLNVANHLQNDDNHHMTKSGKYHPIYDFYHC